jgi:hypothetical protein
MVQLDDQPYVLGRLVPSGKTAAVGDRVDAKFLDVD